MLCDYHLHTSFSMDSEEDIINLCDHAIQNGLDEIAITDHYDLQWPMQDPTYIINLDNYFKKLNEVKAQYDGRLTIKIGIEFGLEPHGFSRYQALIDRYPFDFIIGSLHEINGVEVHLSAFYEGKSPLDIYKYYYSTLNDYIAKYDCFDVVGHLDYFRRYIPNWNDEYLYLAEDIMNDILDTVISSGKGIEVNTSGFRHPSNEPLPYFKAVKSYYEKGGRKITIGSDSHVADRVGFHIQKTQNKLKEIGFETFSRFDQRVEIPTAL